MSCAGDRQRQVAIFARVAVLPARVDANRVERADRQISAMMPDRIKAADGKTNRVCVILLSDRNVFRH